MTQQTAADLDELARACRILELEGHGDRVFGHLAQRDPEGRGLWMKRSGIGLGEVVGGRDFVLLDFDGNKLAGEGRPHSEWPIHSEILRLRADVEVTAHTHPFYASVFSAAAQPLAVVVARSSSQPDTPPRYEGTSELVTSPAMGREVAASMGAHPIVFLRNHGIVFAGASAQQCVLLGIALEKMCHEALTISGSGVRWSSPDAEELAKKRAFKIVGGTSVWQYYLRKLARAEAQGDPLLTTEPVPF